MAFLHDPKDEAQERACQNALEALVRPSPHRWRPGYESPGLSVWIAEPPGRSVAGSALAGPASSGIVLGRLFAAAGGDEVSVDGRITPSMAAAIGDSEGRWLGARGWGSYIAFLDDPLRRRRCVVRDPTGTIPCFYLRHEGIRIFFSDVADIRRSGAYRLRPNPEFIRASVLLPKVQKTITGLAGVEEVLPGEFWSDIAGAERRFIWNPYDFACGPAVDDVEAAAAVVHEVTERTIWTLARPFSRIVHNLGGLDSSIIHACLARAPSRPKIALLNYATASPRGDERHYARAMAAVHGGTLTEVLLDHRKVDIEAVAAACTQVCPLGFFDCIDLAADMYALAEVRRADALFYGVGGDNVFLQGADIFPVLDYVHAHGIDRRLPAIAASAMRYSRWSARHVARAVIRERFAPRPAFDHVYDFLFAGVKRPGLNEALLEERPRIDLLHPLLRPPADIAKGKYFQILSSCFAPVEYYDQFFRDEQVERVHVFYSQPIVEACLRIPSWILAHRGIDRGLARRAFQRDLPDPVLRRLTKGTPDEVYEGVFRDNRRQLREFLLDGVLMKLGIFCRATMERLLSQDDAETERVPHSMLDFLSWEAWARNWQEAAS
jgi:asparagine synthase (glutamine-hydrolysing)